MRCDYHKKITNLDSLGTCTKWLVWAGPRRPEEGGGEKWTLSHANRIKGGGSGFTGALGHRPEGEDRGRCGDLSARVLNLNPVPQPSGNFYP